MFEKIINCAYTLRTENHSIISFDIKIDFLFKDLVFSMVFSVIYSKILGGKLFLSMSEVFKTAIVGAIKFYIQLTRRRLAWKIISPKR